MKHSIIVVGIFSILIAGQVVAHPDKDGMGSVESIGESNPKSLTVKTGVENSTKSEFSALESSEPSVKQPRVPLDDTYDYFPSSWDVNY
jgi:hypothetical protein